MCLLSTKADTDRIEPSPREPCLRGDPAFMINKKHRIASKVVLRGFSRDQSNPLPGFYAILPKSGYGFCGVPGVPPEYTQVCDHHRIR